MAKKKKTRKSIAKQRRSLAAKRGWRTRRLNARRISRVQDHMWRVTISAPYYRRTGKSRSQYRAFAYMVRAWFRTKYEADNAKGLIAKAKAGREKVIQAFRNRNGKLIYPGGKSINIERATKVSFDARLLDIVEEQDERPRPRK